MKLILALFTVMIALSACTPRGSTISDKFTAGIVMSVDNSSITATSSSVLTGSSVVITLSVKDQNGNLYWLPNTKPVVVFSNSGGTSTGSFDVVTNNMDGTYTTNFTGTTAGTATKITATIDDVTVAGAVSIQVTNSTSTNFTMNIPFTSGTDASYTFSNSSAVNLMSTGGVQLTPADQSDSSVNTAATAGGFQNGSMTGVQWDSSNNVLRLNTTTNNTELDASWTPHWSNIVGYWKMNGTGTIPNSTAIPAAVGSSLNLASVGSTLQYSTGVMNQGIKNSTTSYLEAPTSTLLDGTAKLSMAFWVNSSTLDGTARAVACKRVAADSQEAYCIFFYTGNKLLVDIDGSGNRFSTNTVFTTNTWYHVVVVYDGTLSASTRVKVYVNGVLDVTGTESSTSIPATNSTFRLGSMQAASATIATLDDFAIWNGAALSSTEVQTIYQRQSVKYSGQFISRVLDASSSQSWTSLTSTTTLPFYKELPNTSASESSSVYSSQTANLGSNLISLWHLNETTGSTATDSSGSSNNGTIVGGVTTGSSGPFGSAYTFDGTSGYVNLGHNATIKPSLPLTISAWLKLNATGSFYEVFSNDKHDSSNYYGAVLQIQSDNTIAMEIGNGGAAGPASRSTFYTTGKLSVGIWYHVVAVVNTYNNMQIFVNGKSWPGSYSGTGTSLVYSPAQNASIGIRGTNGPDYFSGVIDEVAFWSRALSSTEVINLYRRGANRITYQIRSCSASDCSDQEALTAAGKGWKGPDNTQLSSFSELYNTTNNVLGGTVSASAPTMNFSNFSGTGLSISSNRYFQYRAYFESDDANNLCTYNSAAASCSPELQSVAIGPNHYDKSQPYVITNASLGSAYHTIDADGFTETLGSNSCSSGTAYALSKDGTHFYYWNGTTWAVSTGYSTAASAALTKAHIASFSSTVGTGTLQIKTYLNSDGASACEINKLQVTGQKL